ncbi:MAG: type II toxin-antitoxin system Phd/YefM family antitoxin [Methylococcales bacterium]
MLRVVSKSKFKARALEFFRQVEEAGEEFTITDHGRPVVKVVPYSADSAEPLKGLRNSVLKYEDPMEPVGLEDWKALK